MFTNYTDIENSENKKPIRNFRLGCSRLLYQVAQNVKRQLKHKREAKRGFDNSRKIWENPYHQISTLYLPAVSSGKECLFANWLKAKPADIASIQNWKSEQTVSFLSEETDIASFLNTFAKSAETDMHHSLSLFNTLEFDAGAE